MVPASSPTARSLGTRGVVKRLHPMTRTIQSHRHGFVFDGCPKFILSGTINYFRLHPDDWRLRLEALKACGFNTVDTYVAWNYHEQREGEFDFSAGNRDLDRYLSLCGELGLWVYFRPGPYICNEWDGGGLPTWLYTKPEVDLRQNQPAYLSYALRYLHQVNQIASKHLYTDGGPVILYALENELDFYHCRDPHGYISALKNQATQDGIDVPLTCCIGLKTHIKAATGLVDGVIPSPNIYANGPIDRVAATTYLRLLAGTWASGKHMDDIPVFVTEMHGQENQMRRMLSGGFKGLSPFNFSGGTHFGRWNSTSNWGGQVLIPSSIDFSCQITFDGRLSTHFYASRLLAGLIHAFEDHLLSCDPLTNDDRGPTSPNPQLGWKDTPESRGLINSLLRDDCGFMFLYNGTNEPQDLKIDFHGKKYPRFSTSPIAPGYTHIALLGLPMQHMGIDATIRYSTAEVAQFTPQPDSAELVLYGPAGQAGEICFDASVPIRLVENPAESHAEGSAELHADESAQVHAEGDNALTLVVTYGLPQTLRLMFGTTPLTIKVLGRADAETYQLPIKSRQRGSGQDLTAGPWTYREMIHTDFPHTYTGEPKALETLGIYQGAAWYEGTFTLDAPQAGPITFAHAAEFVSAYLDGVYLETQLGKGGPMTIALPEPLAAGTHTLRLRTEIWGHANFNEGGWPSGGLGSLRGLFGPMTLGDQPLADQPLADQPLNVQPPIVQPLAATWRCGAESLTPSTHSHVGPLLGIAGKTIECTLDLPDLPLGATLVLQGTDAIGDLFVGPHLLGRFAFGPLLPIRQLAGPGNEFYLPKALVPSGSQLRIHLRTLTAEGQLTSVVLHPME